MKKKILNGLIVISLSTIIFTSCREDIVAPGNPAGNINQPVRLKSHSSYIFIINADDISTTLRDYSGITSRHTKLLLSLYDYKQGRGSFNIVEFSNQLIYQKELSDNIEPLSVSLEGNIPDIINISFIHFTGKLKIQVYSN